MKQAFFVPVSGRVKNSELAFSRSGKEKMRCFEKYVLEIIVMLNSFFASALIKQIPKQVRKTVNTPEKKIPHKSCAGKKMCQEPESNRHDV